MTGVYRKQTKYTVAAVDDDDASTPEVLLAGGREAITMCVRHLHTKNRKRGRGDLSNPINAVMVASSLDTCVRVLYIKCSAQVCATYTNYHHIR